MSSPITDDAPLDSKEPALVRSEFVARMEKELQDNATRKGDWREWKPDVRQLFSELDHHLNKLKQAIILRNSDSTMATEDNVSEFAADLANITMKADELYGAK